MLKERIRNLFREDNWNIHLIFQPGSYFLGSSLQNTPEIVIPNERGAFYADPFILQESPLIIICEEFIFSSQHGRIVSLTLDEKFQVTNKQILLEDITAHYSYPFVFKEQGETFVIPESSSENNIVLYKYLKDTQKLERVSEMLSGKPFLDSTIVKKDGLYFLFTSTSNTNLLVYYSETLDGNYTLVNENIHENNPKSRSAGNFFFHGEKLIRPSQDCTNLYGGGLVFNEVTALSSTAYSDKVIHEIHPEKTKNRGIHTLNSENNISVIDRKKNVLSLAKPFFRLYRKLLILPRRKKAVQSGIIQPKSRAHGEKPLKILFLLDFYPFPEDLDGRTKIMANILNRIREKATVKVVCVIPKNESPANVPDWIEVRHPSHKRTQEIINRLSFLPLSSFSGAFISSLNKELNFSQFDLIHTAVISWSRVRKMHPNVVLGINDSLSLGINPTKFRDKIKKIYFRTLELNLSRLDVRFSLVAEKDGNYFPQQKTWILPNGVEPEKYLPVDVQKIPDTFVFHGVLDYQPNLDAIHYMSDFLKKTYPKGTLYLVGRITRFSSTEFTKSIKNLSNCVWVGEVDNISREIAKYECYLALMNSGAGLKNKLLEAMSCSCLVIANKKAIEGMPYTNELLKSVYIVDNESDFQQVFQQKDEWEERKKLNRQFVQKHSDWDQYVENLLAHYQSFVER